MKLLLVTILERLRSLRITPHHACVYPALTDIDQLVEIAIYKVIIPLTQRRFQCFLVILRVKELILIIISS